MVDNLDRFNSDTPLGLTEDVPLASIQLKHTDIYEGLLIDLNDSGYTFDEIADYLDRVEKKLNHRWL